MTAKVSLFISTACWAVAAVSSFFLEEHLLLFTSLAMLAVNLLTYKIPRPDRSRFWRIFDAAVPLLLVLIMLARYFSSEN